MRSRAIRLLAGALAGLILGVPVSLAQTAVSFDGADDHIAFGNAAATPELGLAQFTVEFWLRRTGTGTTTSTGTGGFTGIPLVTKGRGEAEASNVDLNYFVGIRTSDNVIAADFEEGAGQPSPGLNHPVFGTTPIVNNTWYHVAVTYNGGTWTIYLNGQIDGTASPGVLPRSDSIQHFGMGTAFNSTGSAQGRFLGTLDEVRVWNSALSQSEILSRINSQVPSATGLVGRWGFNEGSGTSAADSTASANTGTLVNGVAWVAGAPFNIVVNDPPDQPTLVGPADEAQGVSLNPTLEVNVTDPDADALDVVFYGRQVDGGLTEDFTLIALPDTQFYSCGAACPAQGGNPATFTAQTQWILDNLNVLNIEFVTQLGDCTQNGDNGGNPVEWEVASNAFGIIEDPVTTLLADGIPFGIAVGNHDQSPIGNPDGTTTFYNQYFGEAHFAGRAYYGGHHGSNNDNHFELFTGGGVNFIIVHLEYDTSPDAAVLNWANNLLQTYSDRKAIVSAHYLLDANGSFGAQGQATYDALKANPNLFLMLCGHNTEEARRSDTFAGNQVHTLLSDYQNRANGGNGWLRILKFNMADNTIDVQTYSPTLDQYEQDASSEFTLTFTGGGFVGGFSEIGSDLGVASGANASIVWSSVARSLPAGATFEWYVEVSDGSATTTSPVWTFTTACGGDAECDDANACTDDVCSNGVCHNTNNSDPCDDGDLCTESDACSDGSCAGTPVSCGGGEVCDGATGICVAPVTVSFQQGVSGYTGTMDTFLDAGNPNTDNSANTNLVVDVNVERHILLRFDNIFGSGAGQVPSGATILSADLTIQVTNESVGVGASLHRMLQTWDDSDTWNTWGSGIQANGVEAATSADTSGSSDVGPYTLDVTSSVAGWVTNPSSNHGWAWLPPVADNSWQFNSAEAASNQPLLEITYLPKTCASVLDCDDSDLCTIDACVDELCEYTPVTCDPGEFCSPVTGQCEVPPAAGDVIIAAVQSWNDPGADNPGEFVELFNTTDRTIALDNMTLVSRVDTNADGVLDVDWQLAADLTGKSIAPYSFFLIAESDVDAVGAGNGLHDIETDMDLATGEGGAAERAISLQLAIDGVHMDYVVYGRHDGSDTAAVPPGDIPFAGFAAQTLVPTGAVWSYLDNGSNQGTAWIDPGFDDGAWATGPAELGYGDGGEATVVNCGACGVCPCNPKHVTTYFRRSFDVVDAAGVVGLTLRLVRDDGAVVYLNGVEVARPNMPAGTITFTTLANVTVGGADESTFFNHTVDPALLVEGQNVLAVEIHQDSTSSSDISFNLELLGTRVRSEVCRNTRGTDNFVEGLLRRESAEHLHAGHAVNGFYTDEASLAGDFPVGVWTSPHDEENDAYEARNSTSPQVLPPGACEDNLDCNDGNLCTDDICDTNGICSNDAIAGCCVDDAECDDTDPCTADACTGNVCDNSPIPNCCVNDDDCDDASACTTDACLTGNLAALSFDGVDDQVAMGAAPGLNAAEFTLECWFRKTGAGDSVSTGTGGLTGGDVAVPLVTKGRGEADGDNRDMNYFLGLHAANGQIVADYEEHISGTTPGLNHPIIADTPVTDSEWHHAAVTYGGGCWQVYLDGVDDNAAANCPGQPPNFVSIQHFAIGTALTSIPAADGRWQGEIDEVRVWDHARSAAEIAGGMDRQIITSNGLLGRWSLNEGASGTVADSSGNDHDGTITGAAWVTTGLPDFGLGACTYTPIPGCCEDELDCDDTDLCTVDICSNSTCEYTPVDCSAFEDDCNAGVCNPGTGECEAEPANEGGACDDLDACTEDDVCASGVCAGTLTDCDGDTVCDLDDNCPTVANPSQDDGDFDGFGDACDGPFDLDHDGDVDLNDYAVFVDCIGGPDVLAAPPGCSAGEFGDSDIDSDGDVDLFDAAELQLEFTGSLASPCD